MAKSQPEGGTVATGLESTADAPSLEGGAPSTLAPVAPGHYTCGAELARAPDGTYDARHPHARRGRADLAPLAPRP